MTDTQLSRTEAVLEHLELEQNDDTVDKFVAFTIGDQSFCVDIMSVREIKAWTGTTSIPSSADFVRGVINLRGIVVPIIDLRARFGIGETEPTTSHVIVVVAIGERLNGLLVDTVSDILTVRQEDIVPVPDSLGDSDNSYLTGLITQNDQMVAKICLEKAVGAVVVH